MATASSSFTALIVPTAWVSGSRGSRSTGCSAEATTSRLIDAKAINLPMLDRMYKEYPKGHAPEVA